MNPPGKPSVLVVHYTHTQQSLRVAEAMAGVLRERVATSAWRGSSSPIPATPRGSAVPVRLGWLDHSRSVRRGSFLSDSPPGP